MAGELLIAEADLATSPTKVCRRSCGDRPAMPAARGRLTSTAAIDWALGGTAAVPSLILGCEAAGFRA